MWEQHTLKIFGSSSIKNNFYVQCSNQIRSRLNCWTLGAHWSKLFRLLIKVCCLWLGLDGYSPESSSFFSVWCWLSCLVRTKSTMIVSFDFRNNNVRAQHVNYCGVILVPFAVYDDQKVSTDGCLSRPNCMYESERQKAKEQISDRKTDMNKRSSNDQNTHANVNTNTINANGGILSRIIRRRIRRLFLVLSCVLLLISWTTHCAEIPYSPYPSCEKANFYYNSNSLQCIECFSGNAIGSINNCTCSSGYVQSVTSSGSPICVDCVIAGQVCRVSELHCQCLTCCCSFSDVCMTHKTAWFHWLGIISRSDKMHVMWIRLDSQYRDSGLHMSFEWSYIRYVVIFPDLHLSTCRSSCTFRT